MPFSYSTLFTHDRTAVADTLRRFVDEEEMVRRIICIATTEGALPLGRIWLLWSFEDHWLFDQRDIKVI